MSSKATMRVRIGAVDLASQRCCPNCNRAVRIARILIEFHGEFDTQEELERARVAAHREVDSLRDDTFKAIKPPMFALTGRRGGAAQAAILEDLAARGDVVCIDDGGAVDVPGLVARLKAGAVWS